MSVAILGCIVFFLDNQRGKRFPTWIYYFKRVEITAGMRNSHATDRLLFPAVLWVLHTYTLTQKCLLVKLFHKEKRLANILVAKINLSRKCIRVVDRPLCFSDRVGPRWIIDCLIGLSITLTINTYTPGSNELKINQSMVRGWLAACETILNDPWKLNGVYAWVDDPLMHAGTRSCSTERSSSSSSAGFNFFWPRLNQSKGL